MNNLRLIKSFTAGAFTLFLLSCNNSNSNTENNTATTTTTATVTDKILQELNDKIAADSTDAKLYHLRSKYYLNNKKFGLAKDDGEKAIELDSTKTDYYLTLADIYFYVNETRATNDLLVKCLSIDPNNKEANFRMAELQFYIKHYDDAIKYGKAAYETDTKDLKTNYLLGMILKEKGDTVNAIKFFRNCIDIKPDYFDVYDQMGYIEKARNKPEALDYFNTALKINSESITSLYGRALCYQNKNDFDNAIKDYTAITQLKPDFKDAYFNMGYIHQVNLKMYREAIKYYDQSLVIDSLFTKAVFNKGYCFEQLGDIGNARIMYQKCIEMEPEFKKARESLKRVMK
ncbi:MAG: tetratricopeptide repeat protein [Bacteroidia bacterium]